MPKHNNVIHNNHFRKDWQRYVKTFFDQPAKKKKRYLRRKEKAARLAPRPVDLLRPAVSCMSIRYNMKIRKGRGFTPAELKAVGLSSKTARTIGIAVDRRRKNKSEEGFDRNVARLKEYMAKVVILSKKEIANRKGQPSFGLENSVRKMADVSAPEQKMEVMKLSKLAGLGSAYGTLRYARHQKKMLGPRDKARKAAEEDKK